VDETKPTRFSRRILLNGAAGAALSAILSACTVATATETPAPATTTPIGAAPSPTRAVAATGSGGGTATSPASGSATGTAGATPAGAASATARSAPGIVTIATGVPSGPGSATNTVAPVPTINPSMPTRFATPTPQAIRGTGAPGSTRPASSAAIAPPNGMSTPGRTGTANASAPPALPGMTPTATADLGPAPDPSSFTLVTANATGNPNGVKVPTDLNGRLGLTKLTIALPPSDDPQKMLAQNAELLNYMRAAFAIDVVGAAGKDYTSVSDAMAQRAVDVAFLSPAAYALAYRDAGASPLVNGETGDGKPVVQNTFILVPSDSPVKSLVELRAKTISVVDGDPLPGHWIASWLLLDRGKLIEDRDYTTSAFGTHIDSYGAVADHRADAGAVLKQTYQAAVPLGTVDESMVRVLDSSFDIPANLMAVRGGIAQEDIDLLALAFLTLNDQPANSRLLQSFVLGDAPGTGQFGPGVVKLRRVDDTAYAELRTALDTIKLDLRDAGYKVMQPNAEDPNPYNQPVATKAPPPAASVAATAGGSGASTSRPGSPVVGTARATGAATGTATSRPGTAAATPRPTNAPAPTATARAPGASSATLQPTARSATAPSGGPASGISPIATAMPGNVPTAASTGSNGLPGSFVTANASTNLSGVNAPMDLGGQLGLRRLVVAFPPTDDPARTLNDYANLLAYLRAAFNIDVIGAANRSGTAIVDAMRNKQVDLAFLSSYAYLLANSNANANALIQGEGPDGKPLTTNTVMLARADSAFGGLRDLGGTNIGFVETDPVVGRVVPTFMLRTRANLTEGKDYRVTSIGTHADAYQAVLDGVIDAAAIAADAFAIGVDAGAFDGNAIKTLDASFAVPETTIAIRNDIGNTDADRIGLAFLTINDQQRSSRLFNSVVQPPPKGKGAFGLLTNKLRRADDGLYNELRDAVSRISFNLQALLR